MKILQFICLPDPPATQLKQAILAQINEWSRLRWLCNDPEYVTQQYDLSLWKTHTTTPGLHWFDYDSVYQNIGDSGRIISDQMLGDKPLQGILRTAPLVASMPNVKIQIVDVADLVKSGYLKPPVSPVELGG